MFSFDSHYKKIKPLTEIFCKGNTNESKTNIV